MVRSAISYIVYIMFSVLYNKLYDNIYTENSKLYFVKLLYTVAMYYTLYSFIIRENVKCIGRYPIIN